MGYPRLKTGPYTAGRLSVRGTAGGGRSGGAMMAFVPRMPACTQAVPETLTNPEPHTVPPAQAFTTGRCAAGGLPERGAARGGRGCGHAGGGRRVGPQPARAGAARPGGRGAQRGAGRRRDPAQARHHLATVGGSTRGAWHQAGQAGSSLHCDVPVLIVRLGRA